MGRSSLTMAQAAVVAVLAARFARGRRRRPPLAPGAPAPSAPVSVVIPARDEAARIGPCLAGLRGVDAEVLVVDDRSSDATAEVARAAGARVIEGRALPAGWVGKAWALQQGLEAARGSWVVFLDADTRPKPGLVPALVELAGRFDLLTAGPRFVCESAAERLLHPSMAATIPYRAGPADVDGWQPRPARALANGQCVVVRREPFLAAGAWARVRDQLVEDIALARSLRAAGWRIGFADAADLLEVRMYESAAETLTGWGRSLMGPGLHGPLRQATDLAVLWIAMALPLPRLVARRATPLDAVLVAVRLGIHAALARSYRPRGLAFALAPLADAPVVAWLTWCALRPSRTWRGRTYARRTGRRSAS
ncbi:MAG TPA: glycosyltransferase [Capillimicrobium sp.]|nr:glycosyltransferase [Capillimicrobium sp.]